MSEKIKESKLFSYLNSVVEKIKESKWFSYLNSVVEKIKKSKLFWSIILILMLGFFVFIILLDCVYHDLLYINALEAIWNEMRSWKTANCPMISYRGSYEILKGTIGVLMTTISIFLTMTINIANRREQKVFGIPRSKLTGAGMEVLYKWMRRWNCLSPILMIGFINISFCLSGYMVFFYCYLFSVLHYYLHRSSFSREKDRKCVVNKIIEYSDFHNDQKKKMEYYLLLENMRKSIIKEGNWEEAELLFKEILTELKNGEIINKYRTCMLFYEKIYWTDNSYEYISLNFIKNYLKKWEKENIDYLDGDAKEWYILWGVLKNTFREASEKSIVECIEWILKYRGDEVYQEKGKKVPYPVLKMEWEMCIIALEYRIQYAGIKSDDLAHMIKKLWDLGEDIFRTNQGICSNKIMSIEELNADDEISMIINNIMYDYINGCNMTKVASIASI